MIAPPSAWVRVGLRRMPNTPSRNTGNTSSNLERARLRLHPSNASRRYNSTTPEGGQDSATTARTIPGPSWLWLDPIVEPFRAYGRVQQRRPYMTQLVSSLIIYFIGDCVAQSITRPEPSAQQEKASEADETDEKGWVQQWSDDRDWSRTMRALAIGGLSAIPSYRWFLWLSHSFNYRSKTLSLSIKVFINQAFFTPLFNSYFFGMQTLLSGGTFPEIIERIKNTVPTSWWNSCKIWPAVTAFSFSYVPIQYRSIFGGVVAIGWQTYLNLLNQQAAAEEELERAAGHVAPANVMTVHTNAHHGQAMEKCAA